VSIRPDFFNSLLSRVKRHLLTALIGPFLQSSYYSQYVKVTRHFLEEPESTTPPAATLPSLALKNMKEEEISDDDTDEDEDSDEQALEMKRS
jgi:hypothetical protein